MWGKEERSTPPVREAPHAPPVERIAEPLRDVTARGGMATIGKNLLVKGQIGGSEDLYIDGEVEGSVELKEHSITVGPNGRVNANLYAKDIVVLGKVKGNIRVTDRLEIRKTGSLVGDIITTRVVIEDGAYFKGSIDIQKPGAARTEAHPPLAAAAHASSLPSSAAPPPASPPPATPPSGAQGTSSLPSGSPPSGGQTGTPATGSQPSLGLAPEIKRI